MFLFSKASVQTLGPTQPLILIPDFLHQWVKRGNCEADDVKNQWSCTFTLPTTFHTVHKDTLLSSCSCAHRKERVKWEAAFLAEQVNGCRGRNWGSHILAQDFLLLTVHVADIRVNNFWTQLDLCSIPIISCLYLASWPGCYAALQKEAVRCAMSHGVIYKKTVLLFLILSNANARAVLHRTVVINELVFVMGSVDVFCEVQTEFLGLLMTLAGHIILRPFSTIRLTVCDQTSTTKQLNNVSDFREIRYRRFSYKNLPSKRLLNENQLKHNNLLKGANLIFGS